MGIFYTVQIKTSKCNYQLRVNDILAYIESGGHNIDFELPVNQLVLFGLNSVNIKILPLKSETALSRLARIKITVYQNENGDSRENRTELANYQAPDFKDENKNPPPALTTELKFEVMDPFFKKDITITELQKYTKEEIYPKVVSYYRNFHQLMTSKNIYVIMDLLQFRMERFSNLYYENKDDFIRRNKEFYDEMFANQDIIAWPLEKQKLILFDNYNNRLFTLKNEIQQSPLIFYDQKQKESHYVDFFLGKELNGTDLKIFI